MRSFTYVGLLAASAYAWPPESGFPGPGTGYPGYHPGPPSGYQPGAPSGYQPGNHGNDSDKLGAVSSENSICSEIGLDCLRKGGNAADSIVATTLCVNVVSPYHSCIAGGGYMLVRGVNGSYSFIDFRETAPAASTQDMYNSNPNTSLVTGLASGVPGELKGLYQMHTQFGSQKISWKDLVLPAVNVARYGFPVGPDLVRYMASATTGIENFLVTDPSYAIDFAPNGTLVGLGDILTRKRYADTLESIAIRGIDAFYKGPIAQATINAIQSNGGIMTLEDLSNYTVAIREPGEISYRDFKIHSTTAPSSGSVVLSVMKIIEGYQDIGEAATINESTHYFDEALRFAYGMRTLLGDPSFNSSINAYQFNTFTEETATEVRSKIEPFHTQDVSAYDPSGIASLQDHGTSAIVASDASGMSIALTTTVNTLFGSHIMVPETGVQLNNEMNDFSIPGASNAFGYIPSEANYIVAGKRPLSSICPTIVEHANGTMYFAVSSAGGSRIITAVLQNLWHVLDQNMTAPEALAAPRLHDQLEPNTVSFEYAYNNETTAYMASLGHNVTWVAPGQSTAQSLRRLSNGTFEAAGEPRQLESGGLAI